MLTALRRLWGQDVAGPSGVADQSNVRIRSPISPPPVSHAVAGSVARSDRSVLMLGAVTL